MKVRLLTSLGILVLGLPLLLLSKFIIYPLGLALVSTVCSWELLRVFGMHKRWAISVPTLIMAPVMPFLTFYEFLPREKHTSYLLALAMVIFAYLLYLAAVAVLAHGQISYSSVAAVFMSISYVVVSFTALGLLRYMENGVFFFELVFIGAWVSDAMAYFTGRLFGKHKLCPEISPKKTVEGSIGGIIFDVLACLLYGFIVEFFFPTLDANYLVLGVCGLVLSVVSQMGDLWASLIKRERGVKDYSRILPGHGGILDRFDSCLPICAVLLVICIFFPPFVGSV